MSDSLEVYYGDLCLTEYPYSIEFNATDYGSPQSVSDVVASLTDGEVEVSSRAGNRSMSMSVLVEGADFVELAVNGEALAMEADKARNLLTIDPGDGFGPPTKFDTFRAPELPIDRSEAMEGARLRRYLLTVRALPFGRSETPQTITPTGVSIGTARQKSYLFDVEGSARTEAAIHVGGGAGGLGSTLIYTRPGPGPGMIPLRQYKFGGIAETTDATRVSGAYESTIAGGIQVQAPKVDVVDGTYILVSLVRAASGGGTATLSAQVQTRLNNTFGARSEVNLSSPATLTTAWSLQQIGTAFQLPAAVLGSDTLAAIRAVISASGGGITVRHDESWLIEIGSGTLTWPSTGIDTSGMQVAPHAWVDPPSIDQPYRRVLRGVEPDRSDAFGAETYSRGIHRLEPGENFGFLVTADDDTSVMDLTVERRFFTHATS